MAQYTGLDRDHIEVVPPPVAHHSLFKETQPIPDHPWFRDTSGRIVLGAGELCYRKDFLTLLKAFALLKEEVKDLRLVIICRGKEKGRF